MSPLPPRRQQQLQSLVDRLGLASETAIDWSLLDLALTHPSVSPENNYEQLEFVGDAVVRLAAATVLKANYPDGSVGEFSAVRSVIVSDRTLADWGELYGLDRFVWASTSVLANRKGRVSLLADCFEAILGALYLSTHDLSLVHPWLDEHLLTKAEQVRRDPAYFNYKDALQEWTQGSYKCLPDYQVVQSKTPEPHFQATVWVQGNCLGQGEGTSKKAAEQAAAREAYQCHIAPKMGGGK